MQSNVKMGARVIGPYGLVESDFGSREMITCRDASVQIDLW